MNNDRDKLYEAINDQFDSERIIYALRNYANQEGKKLLEQNNILMKEQTTPKHTCRRIEQVVTKEFEKQNSPSRRIRKITLIASVIVCIMLLTCTVFGGGLFDFFWREFNGYASISNVLSASDNSQLYTVLEDTSAPNYLPKGYQYRSHEDAGDIFTVKYSDNEGNLLTFTRYNGNSQILVDTENVSDRQDIQIHGLSGVLLTENGFVNLVWGNNPQYQITGSCKLEDVVKMAQSVPVKK